MKALAKTKPGPGASVIDVEVPETEDGEVLVKVRNCAICGTDTHRYYWSGAARNDARSKDRFPRILGHEFSGEIVKLGAGVKDYSIGDRVTAETHVPCGKCSLCRSGRSYNCLDLKGFKNGVFAEYAVINASSLIRLPDDLPFRTAATLEPFCVAVHAVSGVDLLGKSVLITGAGPIGLYVLKLAVLKGASKIIVSDTSSYHRELAARMGAGVCLDAKAPEVFDVIMKETGGFGAEVVFECSGSTKAVRLGFDALRKCGLYLMLGMADEPFELNINSDIITKAAEIRGIYGREIFNSWVTALSLLESGSIEISDVITHDYKLFNHYEEAFDLAHEGLSGKIVFSI